MNLPGKYEIHIWQVALDDAVGERQRRVLSPDEEDKAAIFATPTLRRRYRRCRSALRGILGNYLEQPAATIRFDYGRFGKPELAGSSLHFNVSHSGGLALIAVAREPVGIDLEVVTAAGVDVEELAALVCHPAEHALLESLSPADRQRMFYRIWTQKEAYCKALGLGLQKELSALRLHAGAVIDQHAEDDAKWFCHAVPAADEHQASLCIPHSGARLTLQTYRPGEQP